MRPRHTTPPAVLPLLPVCLLALIVAGQLAGILAAVALLVGGIPEDDDVTAGSVAVQLGVDLALFVGASVALRWVVERWVLKHPPRPGPGREPR